MCISRRSLCCIELTMFHPVSSAVAEDSENGSSSVCKESGPELIKSHDIFESSSGSEPMGLNHSGEERDSAHYVGEPETTAMEDASERSVGSAFVTSKQGTNCLLLPQTTRGHIDTTSLLYWQDDCQTPI